MGTQIKGTWKVDSVLFKTTIATTDRLIKRFEFLADSLKEADSYKGDNSINKKAIKLLRLYSTETVPIYADFINDHYNVYGKNDIMSMTVLGQDSLNQIIIKSQENMLAASEKQGAESQDFVNYIIDWVERFKEKRKNTAHNNVLVPGGGSVSS